MPPAATSSSCQPRATRGKSDKGPKKRPATSKAAGKAKAANISPPSSEGELSESQTVGSSQKRKRSSNKSPSMARLQFDQFPPSLQKQLLKHAQTQARNDSAAADREIQHNNERLLAEDVEATAQDQYNSDREIEGANNEEEPELDDEEQQIAAQLPSLPKTASVSVTSQSGGKLSYFYNVTDFNPKTAWDSLPTSFKDSTSQDPMEDIIDWSDDNGMVVKLQGSKPSGSKRTKCSTPSSQSQHSSITTSQSNKRRKAGRIVEEDFNPLARQVAIAAKSHFRLLTVYDDAFPPQGIGRFEYGWKAIKAMVNKSKNSKWQSVLQWANDESDHPQQLVKFAFYGRAGLFSGVVARVREKLPSFYSLSGSRASIKADVEWLIEESRFIFGSVDLKQRTFDDATPFDSELIVQVIQSQWFPSSNRQKADMETAAQVYEDQSIPLGMVLLTITAIEHVLHEWSPGVRPSVPQMFSEEAAKASYIGFEEAWNQIAAASPGWKAQWRRKLYQTIVRDFVHLPSGSGSIKKPLPAINFQKLNAGFSADGGE